LGPWAGYASDTIKPVPDVPNDPAKLIEKEKELQESKAVKEQKLTVKD